MEPQIVRIGLVLGHSLAFFRQILQGVRAFAAQRSHWTFIPIPPDPTAVDSLLRSPHPPKIDGVIAHIYTTPLARKLRSLNKPVVNVAGVLTRLRFPRVFVDHVAVGRIAAEHLLGQGLRNFGFVGHAKHEFSIGREAGFRKTLATAGFSTLVFHDYEPSSADPTGVWRWSAPLLAWLAAIPKPVGILAANDILAVQLSEYCRQLQLHVPTQVAIVGVDDDDLVCSLARPVLSSVALPGERIGFEAARMLELLLQNQRLPSTAVQLPPGRLIVRESSDVQAIPDQDVAAAVRFIRDHAVTGLSVDDVVMHVNVARRSLERRFMTVLQRSVWEEIRRVQMDQARGLLADTNLPMSRVAELSGLTNSRHLSIAFRKEMGETPTEYRQKHRVPDR